MFIVSVRTNIGFFIPENEYFLFEIEQDELTGDVALIVTDFEYDSEIKGTTMIYDVSMDKLRQTIGG